MSARRKRAFVDPNQIEFGILWRNLNRPFRLVEPGLKIPDRPVHHDHRRALVDVDDPVRQAGSFPSAARGVPHLAAIPSPHP